jgi:rhodanese-related sulfurtransferase
MGLPSAVTPEEAQTWIDGMVKAANGGIDPTAATQRLADYGADVMSLATRGLERQPAASGYFAFDAALNRQARDLFDHTTTPQALTVTEFTAAQAGDQLLVVADPDRAEEVLGYLHEPETALPQMEADLTRASRITATDLRTALDRAQPPVILDVRTAGEREQGAIAGSAHIPLAELPHRLAEIPADRPVVVHCAGGYRSSVAASPVRATGHPDVSDLFGGYAAWQLTKAPATVRATRTTRWACSHDHHQEDQRASPPHRRLERPRADPADLGGHRRDHLTDRDSPAFQRHRGPRATPGLSHSESPRQIRRRHGADPDSTRSILMKIGSDARGTRTLPWLFRRRY